MRHLLTVIPGAASTGRLLIQLNLIENIYTVGLCRTDGCLYNICLQCGHQIAVRLLFHIRQLQPTYCKMQEAGTRATEHIISALTFLRWLPVCRGIDLKIPLLVHKSNLQTKLRFWSLAPSNMWAQVLPFSASGRGPPTNYICTNRANKTRHEQTGQRAVTIHIFLSCNLFYFFCCISTTDG